MRATLPPQLRGPDDLFAAAPRQSTKSKHKTKRKAAAASRKANKKKKRK
jgi:hypothetical protein